jgi:hypothetical protein
MENDNKEERKMPAAMRKKPMITGPDAEKFARKIRENNKKMEQRVENLKNRTYGHLDILKA